LGLPGAGGHMDSTSLHVDGKYNSGDESAAEPSFRTPLSRIGI